MVSCRSFLFMINFESWVNISQDCERNNVLLVAVSKKKPVEDIKSLYDAGQRDFGENYVQELQQKATLLPSDIKWHFIGHLQTNKVKEVVELAHLIHAVDSEKLLREINKCGVRIGKVVNVLLQLYIAKEETKFGMDRSDLEQLIRIASNPVSKLDNVHICGLMGMASNTTDQATVAREYAELRSCFDYILENVLEQENKSFQILSMGMSGDYKLAIEQGSKLVRIGSLIFGSRA